MAEIVFPGQDLRTIIEENINVSDVNGIAKIQIGPGIIQNGSEVVALKAGTLYSQKNASKFNLLSFQRRYVPLQNDLVIGIITARLSEFFRVDIGAQTTAVLPLLNGFEGGSKKNKPTWCVGTVIFARVSVAHPDLEPELACFDPSGKIPADLFGELGGPEPTPNPDINKIKTSLKTSVLVRTSCHFSKKLQNPTRDSLLSALGQYFAFEIASGANGRIYIEAEIPSEATAIYRIISDIDKSQDINSEKVHKMVIDLATSFGKIKKSSK